MMSIERSGVCTWTVPRTPSQWSATARRVCLVIDGSMAPDHVGSERGGRGLPEEDQDVRTIPRGELDAGLQHAARIQPGANGA